MGYDIDSNEFTADMKHELRTAQAKFKPLNSHHEAYAVIKEELDEFWDECRKKAEERDPKAVRKELIQIATMAMRASFDLGLG